MPKNLIVFYTDQQRKDSLGCYGNPVARTPHLDALARRGVVFSNHYAANPVCMPSRASFMTGRHLQAHRVLDNGIALPRTETTLASALAAHGYRTCAVGKLHLTAYLAPAELGHEESSASWQAGLMAGWTGPYFGFDEARLTLSHGDVCFTAGGHYGAWVKERYGDFAPLVARAHANHRLNPHRSDLPVELYSSTWVADEAISYIRANAGAPFFLFVSFPDPHHPFTPPEPYASMFDGVEFPPPHCREGENDRKPFHYYRAMEEYQHPEDGGAHRPLNMTEEDWRRVYAATCAMVSLIDASVGRALACVREMGLEEDTAIAFTTDHGDLLGDHFMLYKGPYPCRSLLNIPFVVHDPGCAPGVCARVMSNIDAMPTLLDLLGVPIPETVQGRSFKPVITGDGAVGERPALCSGWSKDSPLFYHHSLYTDRHRISYFPNQDDGELYDLDADPHELDNLYHDPAHRETRDDLLLQLLRALGQAEPSRPPVVAPW